MNRLAVLSIAALGLFGSQAMAIPVGFTIVLGSDYFQTDPTQTTFGGASFMGVPVGPGDTDTIVQRAADANIANVGGSATINAVLSTLNLESITPFNFNGDGLDNYYITLQSARGGTLSTGTETITLSNVDGSDVASGTFTSNVDVFFDIRKGSLNGAIVFSGDVQLSNGGDSWVSEPPPTTVLVDGAVGDPDANNHSGLATNQYDFFIGPLGEQGTFGGVPAAHVVTEAATPEPATILLFGAGLAGMFALRRRR